MKRNKHVKKSSKKKTLLFVDAISSGIARLLTDDEEAFEIPANLLPDGIREGCRVYLTAEETQDGDLHDEVNSLFDDLGDNP